VIFVPLAAGVSLVTWSLVLAAVLWLVVAAVAVADRPGALRRMTVFRDPLRNAQ
jgi:hypothetical protein